MTTLHSPQIFGKIPPSRIHKKTCLMKFRNGQYMGNARKQIFFGHVRFPSISCSICNSTNPDTWPHVLLHCQNRYIHGLIVKRHNEALWEIRKLIITSNISRCFIRMNAGIFNDKPQENTIPSWLLPCTCNTQNATVMPALNPTSYALKDFRTKPPYQTT